MPSCCLLLACMCAALVVTRKAPCLPCALPVLIQIGWWDDGVVRYNWFFEAWQDKEPALAASTMAFAVSCLNSGALVRRYVA